MITPTKTDAGENYVRIFLGVLFAGLVVLLFLSLSGCSYLARAKIENERRRAVNHLIEAEANILEASYISMVKFKQVPSWPASWPVTVTFSEKKGEAETNFIKLPALPELLIP